MIERNRGQSGAGPTRSGHGRVHLSPVGSAAGGGWTTHYPSPGGAMEVGGGMEEGGAMAEGGE
jgi:hypothetical protein